MPYNVFKNYMLHFKKFEIQIEILNFKIILNSPAIRGLELHSHCGRPGFNPFWGN